MSLDNESFCLYPVYIDATKTQQEGRKYNKTLCVDKPRFKEMSLAFKKLEIECIEEPEKKHPRSYFTNGRFQIKKMYGKKSIVNTLKGVILQLREEIKKEEEKKLKDEENCSANKGYVKNPLGLVPKKKKKGKK
ncbi:Srp19-like signal recognition particle protein [Hamiltosporidium tvaerminnensis]|uniref:Srp19-like signal recognition particle protein n=1 Tax=Hamiltosporidium tvaerminnensis TaxID=1176355 RepID=A0A4V2JV00_9MICR|nr:Srp19-like signal recognition particle protein [Hamiltosporidium tvaerminnensis]